MQHLGETRLLRLEFAICPRRLRVLRMNIPAPVPINSPASHNWIHADPDACRPPRQRTSPPWIAHQERPSSSEARSGRRCTNVAHVRNRRAPEMDDSVEVICTWRNTSRQAIPAAGCYASQRGNRSPNEQKFLLRFCGSACRPRGQTRQLVRQPAGGYPTKLSGCIGEAVRRRECQSIFVRDRQSGRP